MMTGKQLKELVSQIPDDAKVGISTCEAGEAGEGEFIAPELIAGATVQTTVNFPDCVFFIRKAESTIIFDVKGAEQQ